MSNDKKIEHIDQLRFKKLKRQNYFKVVDDFEVLRIKFYNGVPLSKEETIKFITLCKFLIENGHNESIKLNCKILYDNYMRGL